MMIPATVGLISGRSASAQGAAGSGLSSVIIVDFQNKSGIGGDTLSRYATDAVATELTASARYESISRNDVLRTANELGFRAPYDKVQLSRIAQQLGATSVVTGEITYVKSDSKKGADKTVSAGVKIRITDASSGELLNGAAKVGVAYAKPGLSDTDLLAQEAISKSVVAGVKSIISFTLPEGIIISSVGDSGSLQVLINRGSRDGMSEGMDLIVLRDKVRVGKLRVVRVFPTDAECTPLDNTLGLRPMDRVSAVFPMPDFDARSGVETAGRRTNSGGSIKAIGQVLMVIVLGAVVSTAVKGGGSVTNVTAEAGINSQASIVQLTWKDNMFGGGTVEYHIWRTGGINSNPYNYSGTPNGVAQIAHSFQDQPTPFSYWDGTRTFLQAPNPGSNNNNSNNGGGNGTGTTVTPAAGTKPGYTVGGSYVYLVSALVNRNSSSSNNNNSGGNNGGNSVTLEAIETDPVASGQVTPVLPSFTTNPSDGSKAVDLKAVQFKFLSTTGADQYVVEISTENTFKVRNLIYQVTGIIGSGSSNSQPLQSSVLDIRSVGTLKLNPVFAAYVNGSPNATPPTLYWRVGARNSGDKPGPQHAISGNPSDNDQTFRYIYSGIKSFTAVSQPPK